MDDLCQQHGTDKSSKNHNFCTFYEGELAAKAAPPKSILEVGVKEGNSLRVWRDAFRGAEVTGFDINPSGATGDLTNLTVQYTDQNKVDELKKSIGDRTYDLIIDDGGHTMKQQINTLGTYWDHVNACGAFIMEDLHTSLGAYGDMHDFGALRMLDIMHGRHTTTELDWERIRSEASAINFYHRETPDGRDARRRHHVTAIIHKKC